jgi:hypothetical protein
MRQISTILIILFSTLISLGQDTTRIKTVKKYQGKKIRFIGRYDKNGNCYFTKNDGLNGPVIMILGWDFDELNRDIRSIFAHSNVGFSVSEKKYESNLIKTFGYTIDTINEYKIVNDDSSAAVNLNEFKFNPYDIIEKINSKEELENIEDIIKLFKGKKYLQNITYLDSNQNVVKEISFENNGDTSGITAHRYNKWNKEDYFYNEWKGTMLASWEYFGEFDKTGNIIKWFRVEDNNGIKDTGEINYYKYSKTDKLIEESCYNKKEFNYKTVFEYNDQGQLIKEFYYESPNKIAVIHNYTYDKNGNEIEEVTFDLRKSKNKPDYKYKTKYEYW